MTRGKIILLSLTAAALTLSAMAPAEAFQRTTAPAVSRSDVTFVAQRKEPDEKFQRRVVRFRTDEAPGTIIIDTNNKFLYYITGDNSAIRYGVGVGREGFGWSGVVSIGRKEEWPEWRPPAEMRRREAAKGHILPVVQEGGVDNPLGARAMYLYKNGHDTIFRIHGTNQPWTIGLNMSSGCIRMMNKDVEHLYKRAAIGAKVIVIGPGNRQGNVAFEDRGLDIFGTIFGG